MESVGTSLIPMCIGASDSAGVLVLLAIEHYATRVAGHGRRRFRLLFAQGRGATCIVLMRFCLLAHYLSAACCGKTLHQKSAVSSQKTTRARARRHAMLYTHARILSPSLARRKKMNLKAYKPFANVTCYPVKCLLALPSPSYHRRAARSHSSLLCAPHSHSHSHCQYCYVAVEPFLSFIYLIYPRLLCGCDGFILYW